MSGAALAQELTRPVEGEPRLWARLRAMALGLCLAGALAACDSVEERAEKHYENGLALVAEGDPVKASLEFRNTIKLNDAHVGANLELGRIFEAQKNYAAAVFQFRKVIALDPTVLDAHLRLARMLIVFNEVDEAVASTTAAAQIAPDDLEVLTLEAVMAMRLDDLDKAAEKAEAALEIDPNAGDAWIVLAAISRRREETDRALEQADEALRRNPENPRVLLFRVTLLDTLGRTEEMGADLERLVAIAPEEMTYLEALARWQIRTERMGEAVATHRRMADLAPNVVDRQLELVRLVAAAEGTEAAVAELTRLIDARAEDGSAGALELAMADIEIQLREFEAAEARLRRLIEDRAGEDETLRAARPALARLRLAEDDLAGALELLNAALADDPTHAGALTLRGRIRIREERYDAAISDLRAAEAEAPEDPETLRLLAIAHARNGSRDLAGERLAAAVEASDQDADTVLDYVRHLLAEGRVDAADGVLADALVKTRGNPRLLEAQAGVKLRLQDYDAAERIARRFQATPELKTVGDRLMAASLVGQQRYDETVRLLEESGAAAQDATPFLAPLVATHLRNKDVAAARAAVDAALAENPLEPEALRLSATLAVLDGRMDEAETLFRQAVTEGGDNATNHLALFRFHTLRREMAAAEATLRAGIAETDRDLLRLNLAMLLESLGRVEEAIAEYEVLYARQPSSEIVANNLASLISDTDSSPEALARAATIAKRLRDSNVPHFQDTYAWILHRQGDHAGAAELLEEVAVTLSENAIVHYHLGMTRAALGDTEGARAALARAIDLAGERTIPQIAGVREALAELGPAPDPAEPQ